MIQIDGFLPVLYFVGFLALGGGYLYIQWRTGGNNAATSVIAAYKEQVAINQKQISDLTHEVGVLTGQLKEKTDRIAVVEGLIQGRSPEQEQYMKDMREFTKGVAQYMRDSAEIFASMKVFMTQLNANAKVVSKK